MAPPTWTMQQDSAPSHTARSETPSRACVALECHVHWTQQPGLKPCRSACTMVESLRTWNNWSRRSCCSGAHCHRGSLMAVSICEGVTCRLSYRRIVDGHILNTSSTSCRHLYSITLGYCLLHTLKRWTICRSLTYDFFQVVCLQQSCWSCVSPSSVLSVNYEKFA